MSHFPRLLAFLTLCLLVVPTTALAQDASPIASPPTATRLDLAAMTLTPADLAALGWDNLAVGSGAFEDAATIVELLGYNERTAPLQDDLRARLAAAGLQGRYTSGLWQLAVPLTLDPAGGYETLRFVSTGVTEYATAEGAAAGFAALEDESSDPSSIDLPADQRFGPNAEITRAADDATGPRPLNLSFQVENLVADVWLTDSTVPETETATIERIGDLLAARIGRVRAEGGPGLSNRVLRLTPVTGQIRWNYLTDRYARIGGDDLPSYWTLVAELEAAATPVAQVGQSAADPLLAGSRYEFGAYISDDPWLAAPDSATIAGLTYVNVALTRDASVEVAANRFATLAFGFAGPPDPLFWSLDPDAAALGDESFAAVLRQDSALNYYLVARLGAEVVEIFVVTPDAPAAIPAIERLMTEQLACLRATGPCAAIPMPAAFLP